MASDPEGPGRRSGRTRPAATISRARADRTENVDTEAPAWSSGEPTPLRASATSSAAEGSNRRAVTSNGHSPGAGLELVSGALSVQISSGEGRGA